MKKIAICIPTYQRSDIIDELCLKVLPYLSELNVGLYIYDSSFDNDTLTVYERYSRIYPNIQYRRHDASTHSNKKVYLIYQEMQKETYQFVWIWADAVRWSRTIVERVLFESENDYDLIVTNYHDKENIGTVIFSDIREFHKKCAWHMAWYGATAVNRRLLENVDWDYLETKYLCEDAINFSQIGFYFEQIYRIADDFRALHISADSYDMRVSSLRKRSGWYEETFKVWCERWINAMKKLPDGYEKNTSIRRIGVYGELFTWSNLISLRFDGIYNFRIFIRYLLIWNKITYESIFSVFIAAILPRNIAKICSKEYKAEKKIRGLFSKMPDSCKKIWIYGCGYNSLPFVEYMKGHNMDLQGYLVTDKEKELDMHEGYPVIQYSASIFDDPEVAIVICTGEKIRNEILDNLPIKERNRIFYI